MLTMAIDLLYEKNEEDLSKTIRIKKIIIIAMP